MILWLQRKIEKLEGAHVMIEDQQLFMLKMVKSPYIFKLKT